MPRTPAAPFLLTALLVACAAPPATLVPAPRPATVTAASFGHTWDAVIEHFAERSIPIRTLERASGIVITDPMRVDPDRGIEWADCGTGWVADRFPTAGSFNVLVRGDSTSATVKVTARWVHEDKECASRDVFEKELEEAIRVRAQQGR
ncbi:MAG: hypothetical protein KA180_13290 [Gemmatimonadales bacterium]|jgi:hypothetical protein|nr:hypothetical protein [Gemmatimonadales bacterium]MBP9199191.1 hypothetical protein [Gemmatimonadales bacterium]